MTGSRNRVRMGSGMRALLCAAVVACAALAAPSAQAAEYTAQRAGLKVDITTRGDRIVDGFSEFSRKLITCGEGEDTVVRAYWPNARIDRTGEFWRIWTKWHPSQGVYSTIGFRGDRRRGKVVGSTFWRGRLSSDSGQLYYCWTGRAWNDPWVRFVAERRSG